MAQRTKANTSTSSKRRKSTAEPVSLVASKRGRIFDARPDRLDFRDLEYRPPLCSLPEKYPSDNEIREFLPAYVNAGLIRDQGTQGACTGFGLACVANYLLWIRHMNEKAEEPLESVSPQMLYQFARNYDEWPGQEYEGSSCRGALKGWHKHGLCSESFWPFKLGKSGESVYSPPKKGWDRDAGKRTIGVYYRVKKDSVVDLQSAIREIGAVYVSALAHDGWDSLIHEKELPAPKSHGDLLAIGTVKDRGTAGGHAFALVGFNERGFIVQNSWGKRWGASGFALLPYEDWIENATDAWACALGVPVDTTQAEKVSSRWPVTPGQSFVSLDRSARAKDNPPSDPWPVDHEFKCKDYQPWSTGKAYEHTLVSGNDGKIIVSDITLNPNDPVAYVKQIAYENILSWVANQPAGPVKLALYAHGGLNSETESIARIRVLAPYFKANGIYPLFLTWQTGPLETITDMVEDWLKRIGGGDAEKVGGLIDTIKEEIDHARDRALEAVAHGLGRGIWSEMRENAEFAINEGHILDLLATHLGQLKTALLGKQRKLELHLIGHSAGAILLGHYLERAIEPDLKTTAPKVSTCTLFAAACSVGFAVKRYIAAANANLLDLTRLWLYYLSDTNEKRDGLPSPKYAAYGKSLLYLVSRALDEKRKMPLLGMERALEKKYSNDSDQWNSEELAQAKLWQSHWNSAPGGGTLGRMISDASIRNTRAGGQIQATHGSFDNNIDVLTETIERIKGSPLVSEIEWLDY
jgi:hypothetical protein